MSKKKKPFQVLETERILTPEDFGEVLLTPADFGRDTLEFEDFAGEINNAGWDMKGDDRFRFTPDFYMTNSNYVWKEINATHDKAMLEIDRIRNELDKKEERKIQFWVRIFVFFALGVAIGALISLLIKYLL